MGEEEGEGSGPKVLGGEDSGEDVGEVFSGELGGFGKRAVFLSKKAEFVEEAIKGVGRVVGGGLFNFPRNRLLVSEVVGVKWVIRRGKSKRLGYGGLGVRRRIGDPCGIWGW